MCYITFFPRNLSKWSSCFHVYVKDLNFIMVGQKTISSFFKPVAAKHSDAETDKALSPKRQKLSDDEKSGDNSLTPEQIQRIESQKLLAKIKVQARKTPALSSNIGPSWFRALEAEFSKEYFKKVKVVILGQDPYHGPKQAHGLAFSVQKGVPAPPSLVNMYKELSTDITGFEIPNHGNLSGWAKQGVLLLNACLTVRAHNANSHKDQGWEQLTDAVIRCLNKDLKGIVFLLWGSYAQKKGAFIDKKKHLILQCAHPSPLSASRGFFGCHHFSKANDYLKSLSKKPIDWNHLPEDEGCDEV